MHFRDRQNTPNSSPHEPHRHSIVGDQVYGKIVVKAQNMLKTLVSFVISIDKHYMLIHWAYTTQKVRNTWNLSLIYRKI